LVLVKGPGGRFTVTVPVLAKPGANATIGAEQNPATREPTQSSSSGGLGTQRTLALVAGGVGLAGVAVGSIFGFKSKSDHDEAEKFCDGSQCRDARGVSAGEAAHAAGNVSTIAMIAGGAGLAAGITLWFTAPKAARSTALSVAPGGLQLRGSF
jgi:hypothetical protein